MKKATKTPTKKSSRTPKVEESQTTPETPVETSPEETAPEPLVDGREPEAQFDPYDEEAWNWMTGPESIPGAYPPILYIGTRLSVELSKLFGRSLTLEEAQCLVQPDGKKVTCAMEGVEFQPIRYLPFLPQTLAQDLADGVPFSQIDLPYGGSYYVNVDQKPVPISGAVYVYQKRTQDYDYCRSSPLVIMSERMPKLGGRRQWGVSLDLADRKHAARLKNNERYMKADKLIKSLVAQPRRRNFTTIGETAKVVSWKDSDRRNGKKRSKHREQQVRE